MPKLLDRLVRAAGRARPALATKASPPGFALYADCRPNWTPRDPASLALAGYQRNPVVYRAVRLVAESAASLPWRGLRRRAGADGAPRPAEPARERRAAAGDGLCRPDARRLGLSRSGERRWPRGRVAGPAAGADAGVDGAGRLAERLRLHGGRAQPPLRPDGRNGAADPGAQPVPPGDDHGGLPPIAAAATALDIHNAAAAWNKALLDNAARPSGALVFAGASLSETQFDRLKGELEANYQGAGQCRAPAPPRGRARLEAAGALPPRHGFRGGQERGGAGDRPGLRGARRCSSACRGTAPTPTTPRPTAPSTADPDPPRAAHGADHRPLARTGLRRGGAGTGPRPDRGPGLRAGIPVAARPGADFLTQAEKREAVGYPPEA